MITKQSHNFYVEIDEAVVNITDSGTLSHESQTVVEVEADSVLNILGSIPVLRSSIGRLSIDVICAVVATNLWNFTESQIDLLWQAISPRVSSASLPLQNWSDTELKHIIANAQRELNQRQHSKFF